MWNQFIWILIMVVLSGTAHADRKKSVPKKYYSLPAVVAVQNRPYYLNGDLSVSLGALPTDAFNKGYSAGLSYTHYFNDYVGWEIVNVNAVLNNETTLKKDIEALNVDITNNSLGGQLDYITYYALTSIVYTPLYNKSLLFNRDVVYGETSFVLGLGAANFDSAGPRFMASAGLYLRFFTSPSTSWKFDWRNNIHFDSTDGATNAMSIGIAYSIQLGSNPNEQSDEDKDVQ